MHTVYTIGYERAPFASVLAGLQQCGVKCVVDVRAHPMARRFAFRFYRLAKTLNRAGIVYHMLPALGCPTELRERYARDHDREAFECGYDRHLADVQADIDVLQDMAATTSTALLARERDAQACHRSLLATLVAGNLEGAVTHILPHIPTR